MTIEQILEKTIEGGYFHVKTMCINLVKESLNRQIRETGFLIECIISDLSFWQSLGKALGWGKEQYLIYWHDLIDHLAEGKTIESYFEKL